MEGWLGLCGYRGDVVPRASELRTRAATALLNAGRIEQGERVVRSVQPGDMHLNALFMEKSGRTEEAATLYERAGSIADARRVRTDVVRDRFQQFERRGGIASSNIHRLSSDERRLVRAARRAVTCPSCGSEVGRQCMGSGGRSNSDSRVERRQRAGNLSFEQLTPPIRTFWMPLRPPQESETPIHQPATSGGGNVRPGAPCPVLAAAPTSGGSA